MEIKIMEVLLVPNAKRIASAAETRLATIRIRTCPFVATNQLWVPVAV
jgi:hypothetical protein